MFISRDSRTTGLQLEEQGRKRLCGLLLPSPCPGGCMGGCKLKGFRGTAHGERTTGAERTCICVCVLGGWCYDKLGVPVLPQGADAALALVSYW